MYNAMHMCIIKFQKKKNRDFVQTGRKRRRGHRESLRSRLIYLTKYLYNNTRT